ncbi:AraC family transcriptional regulator [Leptolyngbya sp. Heron Island J]|uniref:AraC family transcriptional regulator n=1 Tax=Leptolyngbya sp. Heron Island J TaxID=1385935 RepID=UPI0013777DED|nr:AraC family transcriptional regulator [Leptolyngbya sp. Heron Island J]
MPSKAAQVTVQACQSDGILLEKYVYTPGGINPLPKHTHVEYQFGLSFDCQGEYFYRGAYQAIPPGSLSIIHSGEVHAPSDRTFLPNPAHFAMAHIEPMWLQQAAAEMANRPSSEPFFPAVLITDPELNRLFLNLQSGRHPSKLEQETALWEFLIYLIAHYASNQTTVSSIKSGHPAVEQARDYLHGHYADDISLEDMAAIAGLSRFHFCRVFKKTVGITPGAYQTQLRIDQSRKLLAQGFSIATVVEMTGFYDHSHFGWHFKRQVGTTPGSYVRKIVLKR